MEKQAPETFRQKKSIGANSTEKNPVKHFRSFSPTNFD